MDVSVVINTYNRGASLRKTLATLRHQTHQDFEVVVVNGPSNDCTADVIAEYADRIRVYDCPEINLSKSRNIGIARAAGEVVAFIDDDAEPDPRWLEEILVRYDSPKVGGVGGVVYDHTGVKFQYKAAICDRRGNADLTVTPPYWPYLHPQGDRFVHLLGTNATFRRDVLAEVGGFDEEFAYFLDETELCMRVIDHGWWLLPIDGAPVYHRFLASHLRNKNRVLRNPYNVVKSKYYFALQAARPSDPMTDVLADCLKFTADLRNGAKWNLDNGYMTPAEMAMFESEIDRAIRTGLDRGLNGKRQSGVIPPAPRHEFKPFPTLRAEGRRLTVCLVSQEIPPGCGGIGRFSWDLAEGIAAAGHEVHYLTKSADQDRMDYQDGVWVHRLVPSADGDWMKPDMAPVVVKNLGWADAVHREVKRLRAYKCLDAVSSPIWDTEGLLCLLDHDIPSILSLETTFQTFLDMNREAQTMPGVDVLLGLEHLAVRSAKIITAPSRAVLEKVRRDAGGIPAETRTLVLPLGVVDRNTPPRPSRPADGRVRVVAVGRIEYRKGIDVLLEAAARLCPQLPDVEFHLVGQDHLAWEDGKTLRQMFRERYGSEPWVDRVVFTGAVTEDELTDAYADCDVFCLPSRYESFGLVFVEAMAFAKPVVGCAIGGMTEIIQDNVNGFLAYPDDPVSLADGIRRLVTDASLRAEFGRRSRELFEARFTRERMVASYIDVFSKVAHPAAVAPGPVLNVVSGQRSAA